MRKPLQSLAGWASNRTRTTTNAIHVRVAHTDDIRKILNAIEDAGASFLSMDVRKPNLEQVFLKLTGEALHQSARRGEGGTMNLRVIGANLVVSLKSFYREKTAMFFTTMFPILLILVFGTIFMDDDKLHFNLCLQDLDQTETSAEIAKALAATGKLKIIRVDPSPGSREVR